MNRLTTDEKLQHFYDISIESAQEDARKLLDTHKSALDKTFAEHKETKHRQAEAELSAESDKLKRDFNKEVSTKQIQIKRKFSAVTEELREKLFQEVEEKLTNFKKSPDYLSMLCRQIQEALDFAEGDEMVIYIDPSDAGLCDAIVQRLNLTDFAPTVSKEAFMGGMRAVIRSKNILIDNSFLTLMNDEKEKFNLEV
ncbi:MAG: V-type ATP synthase subunit E [Ruminococcus sp.]